MRADLVQATTTGVAVALCLAAVGLLLSGQALAVGYWFRSALEPTLRSIRARSELSRAELADVTIVAAVVVAAAGLVLDRSLGGVIVIPLLLAARPLIRRATREDHKLLAIAGVFSIDLVLGFYVPIVIAQLLLGNLALAAPMLLVMVALSWPAGGGSAIPGRAWRLAPVPTN